MLCSLYTNFDERFLKIFIIVDLQLFCQFLLYSKVTQSYIYTHSSSHIIFYHVVSQEMMRVFIMNAYRILLNAFSESIEMIM